MKTFFASRDSSLIVTSSRYIPIFFLSSVHGTYKLTLFFLAIYRLNTRKCRRTSRNLVQTLTIFELSPTGLLVLRYGTASHQHHSPQKLLCTFAQWITSLLPFFFLFSNQPSDSPFMTGNYTLRKKEREK